MKHTFYFLLTVLLFSFGCRPKQVDPFLLNLEKIINNQTLPKNGTIIDNPTVVPNAFLRYAALSDTVYTIDSMPKFMMVSVSVLSDLIRRSTTNATEMPTHIAIQPGMWDKGDGHGLQVTMFLIPMIAQADPSNPVNFTYRPKRDASNRLLLIDELTRCPYFCDDITLPFPIR